MHWRARCRSGSVAAFTISRDGPFSCGTLSKVKARMVWGGLVRNRQAVSSLCVGLLSNLTLAPAPLGLFFFHSDDEQTAKRHRGQKRQSFERKGNARKKKAAQCHNCATERVRCYEIRRPASASGVVPAVRPRQVLLRRAGEQPAAAWLELGRHLPTD
jgi:hypothetical protein